MVRIRAQSTKWPKIGRYCNIADSSAAWLVKRGLWVCVYFYFFLSWRTSRAEGGKKTELEALSGLFIVHSTVKMGV